ncbi:hypothetical protein AMATHDRAFT_149751 [Amanita thiersii Skay4041]|uniref:Uncharacterized protein n=1 Tax=Amanita thiersii Skay4041 TaxID=703135 RepID=A0A2A9NLE1_9AGAR|nr:hypothetical protein AMATHDRAFT_149751 [Amanita thiersii Skay4041]
MSSRKRKHRSGAHSTENNPPELDPALFVVAYEADIVRGTQAASAAQSLEVVEYLSNQPLRKKIGDALIKWGASAAFGRQPEFPGDEEDSYGPVKENQLNDNQEELWVDRFDACLLLDALPSGQSQIGSQRPESPSGWSDLPSDTEDTFFFSPAEAEDYRREKRRRTLDRAYEERLKARMVEDGDDEDSEPEDPWDGSDEEPDDTQKGLMDRTAAHLISSPNPAQLEMRILANHGADGRFAFLRGRWSRAWRLIKSKARIQAEETTRAEVEASKQPLAGLTSLAGYGDSDDESGSGKEVEDKNETGPEARVDLANDDDMTMGIARRAKAKLWAQNRRRSIGSRLEKKDTA